MADLMVRTGIDARGFKRGLFAMEKDLGDASSRMASRFGGDRGFDPLRLDKGLGKAGAMAIGFNPRTGLIGGMVLGLKDAYGALERYEQKLPEVYRYTADISRQTEEVGKSWARGAREALPIVASLIDKAGELYERFSSRAGSLMGIMMGGSAGPGTIDDFLKDVEYKQLREGTKGERDAMKEQAAIELARATGDTLTADLMETDVWRRNAISKLQKDRDRLFMEDPEYSSQLESINAIDMLKRSEANAKWDREQKERSDAAQKARDDQAEKKRKENDEARKAADEVTRKREDAQVDIYESQARFRNAKATTDEEKKSAEEARAYARYKREELDIKRRGLDVDQQNTLELFNQAEYEATIEAIRARQNDKPAPRLQAPDGLDLSSAGAFASQGQAMAFQIPGKIDRTNALLQQSGQTLQRIEQKLDGTARFAP